MARLPAPSEPLTDGAIVLRDYREEDVPQLLEACADPEIPRWTAVPDPYTEELAREWVRGIWTGPPRVGEWLSLAVVEADDDSRLLGSIGLVHLFPGAKGEIGYWLAPWARGRGVMTSAVRLLSRWAFREFELHRLEMLIAVENEPSQRVAERAGWTREGVLRQARENKGIWRDHVVYSVLPGEI